MGEVARSPFLPPDTFSDLKRKATEGGIFGAATAHYAGHMAGPDAPFLKDAAGTLLMVLSIVRIVRTNRENYEQLLEHIQATLDTMRDTNKMLDKRGTPLTPELKVEIQETFNEILLELKGHLEKKSEKKRNMFDRVIKHDPDKRNIQNTTTRINHLLQLFKLKVDFSNAQCLGEVLDREKDLHAERYAHEMQYRQDLREKERVTAELEKLRNQMALDRERRDEEERIANEEADRESRRLEAERKMAEHKKKRLKGKAPAPAPPPPKVQARVQEYEEDDLYEGGEDDQQADIVNDMDKMEIDDDRRSQMSGVSGGRNSPRARTRLPPNSPPISDFGGSQSARSSPKPQANPLPPRPSRRPKPEPVHHDSDDGYGYEDDQQGGRDDHYQPPRAPASGRYGPRRDDDYVDDAYDSQQSRWRTPPRQYADEDRDWHESGYDRRPPPGRRPQGPNGPPRPGNGAHRFNTAPPAGLDFLWGQQPPQPRAGSGPVITIGSGNITGNYISNVGNTTTTYVNGGSSYGRGGYGRW